MREMAIAILNKANAGLSRQSSAALTVGCFSEVELEHRIHDSASRKGNRKKKRPSYYGRPLTFDGTYEATGEVLGEGSHGQVACYVHRQSGVEYAVKEIRKMSNYNRGKILKEIDIFHHCQGHKNILQLLEYYEEAESFFLVFHRVLGGTLLQNIQRRGSLTELDASRIVGDIAGALSYLHNKGIAHRDLKPENILCDSTEELVPIRICDFDLGNAVIVEEETKTPVTTPQLLTPVGSVDYMAPEVVDAWVGETYSYDKKCDLWSLGIILYIMLCGSPPFYASCSNEGCGWQRGDSCNSCQQLLFSRIQEGTFDFPHPEWLHVSEPAKDLICHLLVRSPSRRYSADQVLAHSWIREPAPVRPLATPGLLQRNNSSQILDVYAEQAMAINRLMVARLAICEGSDDAAATSSCQPSSATFFIGDSPAESDCD